MRIGLMLRAWGEAGGVGVYTRNLTQELLDLDPHNEYVLYHCDPQFLGLFASRVNVEERWSRWPGKALWDQVGMPLACRRDGIDILLHPKFTVPLLAPCPAIMVVHGADWFLPEQARFYHPLDVRYIRTVMPLYFRKCARVLSVSRLTSENFERVLDLPSGKVETVYFGPARHFRPIDDPAALAATRRRYGLPERYLFTLTKRSGGERKNLRQLLAAYALYHDRVAEPLPLVVGGKDCHLFRHDYGIPDQGWGAAVHFPGYLDQADLPAIYSMAELYLYPSNLEAFPIPLTEAMTCGTPIITSDANGLREIAGDAALFVDPADAGSIADAVETLLGDEELRALLRRRGLARARCFSWRRCAERVLEILAEVLEEGR